MKHFEKSLTFFWTTIQWNVIVETRSHIVCTIFLPLRDSYVWEKFSSLSISVVKLHKFFLAVASSPLNEFRHWERVNQANGKLSITRAKEPKCWLRELAEGPEIVGNAHPPSPPLPQISLGRVLTQNWFERREKKVCPLQTSKAPYSSLCFIHYFTITFVSSYRTCESMNPKNLYS